MSGRDGRISACHSDGKLRSTKAGRPASCAAGGIGSGIGAGMEDNSNPDELLDALADRRNAKTKRCALLDHRNQLVEFRAALRAGESDPYWIEELVVLRPGCLLDLFEPPLEDVRRDRQAVCAHSVTELGQY